MKQIAIIMSLVFSVFVLSGCKGKDDKSGKEECDKKGVDWVWNVTEEKCEEAAATKEDCDKKGAGWTWDEANKKCNASIILMTEETCKAKGAGWVWDKVNKQCNSYMTVSIPDRITNKLGEEITNEVGNAIIITVEMTSAFVAGGKVSAGPNECVRIDESGMEELEIVANSYRLCSNKTSGDKIPPCVVGSYKIFGT